MKIFFSLLILIPSLAFAQMHEGELTFSGTGDLNMPLGRYRIGTMISFMIHVDGPWAQDGGIYHIGADWAGNFKVIYRGESSISKRIKFYGYVDPATNSYGYLFATWDNHSPGEERNNTVRISVSSNGVFNTASTGDFNQTQNQPISEVLVVQSNSENVGIGTDSPNEKLEVNGTIRSKEVKVEATPWPDYVFSSDYNLQSLTDLESYIQQNYHLPNIPSAEEVKEDGIALGEMNAKLLEKVEELTLHLIEQDKRSQAQEAKIEKLLEIVIDQQQRISNLETNIE